MALAAGRPIAPKTFLVYTHNCDFPTKPTLDRNGLTLGTTGWKLESLRQPLLATRRYLRHDTRPLSLGLRGHICEARGSLHPLAAPVTLRVAPAGPFEHQNSED